MSRKVTKQRATAIIMTRTMATKYNGKSKFRESRVDQISRVATLHDLKCLDFEKIL